MRRLHYQQPRIQQVETDSGRAGASKQDGNTRIGRYQVFGCLLRYRPHITIQDSPANSSDTSLKVSNPSIEHQITQTRQPHSLCLINTAPARIFLPWSTTLPISPFDHTPSSHSYLFFDPLSPTLGCINSLIHGNCHQLWVASSHRSTAAVIKSRSYFDPCTHPPPLRFRIVVSS